MIKAYDSGDSVSVSYRTRRCPPIRPSLSIPSSLLTKRKADSNGMAMRERNRADAHKVSPVARC
jgi:hypothetical protein